jgi:protoheme IX farnesyltransferase
MLGWVAATGNFGIEAGTLFLIQFFWQFPHFWAIGWFLYEDYEKGGFFMLPSGKKDKSTALQIILYTVWLIIASLLPMFGFTGQLFLSPWAAVAVLFTGTMDVILRGKTLPIAHRCCCQTLMLSSVTYITILQIIYISDKFLR